MVMAVVAMMKYGMHKKALQRWHISGNGSVWRWHWLWCGGDGDGDGDSGGGNNGGDGNDDNGSNYGGLTMIVA